MKASPIAVLALLGAGLTAGCTVYLGPPPSSPPPPDNGATYDTGAAPEEGGFDVDLAAYGEWIDRPDYGRVWLPSHPAPGWRPYTLGHWVETDYGWTWISDEPFGWATYHYGRWWQDPDYGWVWIPGTEWGPAWVAWQSGDGYIGWAPLPPAVGFRVGVGLDFGGVDLRVALAPHAYVFVEERAFLEPHVYTRCLPQARNVTILRNTVNITNYTVVDNRVINRSVDVHRVEQATGHKVQRFQVTDVKPGDRQRTPRVEGDRIALYRPRVKAPAPPRSPGSPTSPATPASAATPMPPKSPAAPATPEREDRRARRTPPPAPTPARPAEVEQKQESDKRALDQHQAAERKRLEDLHKGEEKGRQAPPNAEEMKRRHQEEDKAQAEQQQRDRRQMEARQQREKQAAAEAAAKAKEKQEKEKAAKEKEKDKKKDQDRDKERKPPGASE